MGYAKIFMKFNWSISIDPKCHTLLLQTNQEVLNIYI